MEDPSKNLENVQQYVDFVKTNLEPLATHLKVGVEWLWAILVQQARVEAIVYLILCISFFVTTAILTRIFFVNVKKARFSDGYGTRTIYIHKKTKEEVDYYGFSDYEHRNDYELANVKRTTNHQGVVAVITGSLAGIMLITSIATSASSLTTIVTGLVNPEFRAIEKIVEFAKPNADKVVEQVKQ